MPMAAIPYIRCHLNLSLKRHFLSLKRLSWIQRLMHVAQIPMEATTVYVKISLKTVWSSCGKKKNIY